MIGGCVGVRIGGEAQHPHNVGDVADLARSHQQVTLGRISGIEATFPPTRTPIVIDPVLLPLADLVIA
ncbi:hypothetical protein VTG60DRAFT_7342 [Thermothelomyces hinnuleus]